jgi:RNA polymerase sigma-70 factor (ECF subfamily)
MTAPEHFSTTRWTVIRSARAKGEPGSAEALASLCEAYWYPLYVFVRRLGHGADEARDLTQGYFLRLLEKDYLEGVSPEAGKFRAFLLASLKHYLANVRRDAAAQKRGGGKPLLSLDIDAAENRYRNEPVDEDTPDRAYERRWALAVIDRARSRLKSEFEASDKLLQFRLLAGHLTGTGEARPYREIAEQLGTTEAAVKMSVSRMRRQYGRALREEIADTIDDPGEVDAEVRHLLSSL